MFFKSKKKALHDTQKRCAELQSELDSIKSHVPVIEFNLKGEVLYANNLFLGVVGYSLEEIVGKHHSILCPHEYSSSAEYGRFWESLRAGNKFEGKSKRLSKSGQAVWLEATYFPV